MGQRDTELQSYRATELKNNKKADLELDEIIKIMLGVVLLIILLAIIWYIRGEFSGQGTSIKDSFNIFK